MGIRSLSTASISTGTKRSKVWDQSAAVLTSAYESISTVTLGSAASTITISSIPQTYKHLQVRVLSKFTYANQGDFSNLVCRVNYAESGTQTYSRHTMRGNSTATLASAGSNESVMYLQTFVPDSHSSYANIWGGNIIDILDYTNTNKLKTFRSFGGYDTAGASNYGQVCLSSGLWQSTAAVASLRFEVDSDQFVAGTKIALYGIKG